MRTPSRECASSQVVSLPLQRAVRVEETGIPPARHGHAGMNRIQGSQVAEAGGAHSRKCDVLVVLCGMIFVSFVVQTHR